MAAGTGTRQPLVYHGHRYLVFGQGVSNGRADDAGAYHHTQPRIRLRPLLHIIAFLQICQGLAL